MQSFNVICFLNRKKIDKASTSYFKKPISMKFAVSEHNGRVKAAFWTKYLLPNPALAQEKQQILLKLCFSKITGRADNRSHKRSKLTNSRQSSLLKRFFMQKMWLSRSREQATPCFSRSALPSKMNQLFANYCITKFTTSHRGCWK